MYKLTMTVQGRGNQGRTRETKLCFPPYLHIEPVSLAYIVNQVSNL
jgi:hypothetical protein